MSVMDKGFIDVLNYNDNVVATNSIDGNGHLFEAGTLDEPFVLPLSPAEIKYINSSSNAFKNGVLRFRDNEAEEIYGALGIKNISELMFTERIDEMLLDPSAETMQEILDIKNFSQFERIRGRYYYLTNSGADISSKVGRMIEARYKELRSGKIHTNLSIVAPDKSHNNDDKKVQELEATIRKQQEQLDTFTAMFQQFMDKMAAPIDVGNNQTDAAEKPKKGRSKKAAVNNIGE